MSEGTLLTGRLMGLGSSSHHSLVVCVFLFLYFFVLFFVLLGIERRGHSVFNWLNGKAEVGIEEVHLGP